MKIENGILKYLDLIFVKVDVLEIPKEVKTIETTFLNPDKEKLDKWKFYWDFLEETSESTLSLTEATISRYSNDNFPRFKKVVFEKNSKLTKIGNGAFTNFTSLEELELPNSLEEIGGNFCKNCRNLKTIKLPENLETIGRNPFYSCPKLKFIFISPQTKSEEKLTKKDRYVIEYPSQSAKARIKGRLFIQESVEFLTDKKNPVISNVDCIGENAFLGNEEIETVIIEEGVKVIGNNAFTGCKNLKRVTLPKSLEYIGDGAFWGCESLESVMINSSKFDRKNDEFNDDLTIELPSKVDYVGKLAFANCKKIKEAILPEKIVSLNDGIFKNCNELKTVEIRPGKKIKKIGKEVFKNCKSLEHFRQHGSYNSGINIPYYVTEIGNSAFEKCKKITSVNLPQNFLKLGSKTFADCSFLTNINLPGNLEEIGKECFSNCGSLYTLFLPSSIESIGENAFKDCFNLYKVTSDHNKAWFVSNGVIDNAFTGCYKAKFELSEHDKSDDGNKKSENNNSKINLKGIRDAIKNWRSTEK